VAVAHDGAARPTLILDAGTGVRRVTALLAGQPFTGTILLTHLHWDHVQGLPFFRAGDRDDATVTLLLPDQQDGNDAEEVLERAMSPPHFPIRPSQLRGRWSFGTISPGRLETGGFTRRGTGPRHGGRGGAGAVPVNRGPGSAMRTRIPRPVRSN
jgi:phosphoribosyl 1,2-cyclic phosphodiesterase